MKIFNSLKTKSFRLGGYSVLTAVIVIVIAILANLFVNSIPSEYTQIDTSSNQLFTISDQTKQVVQNLNKDVSVYWVVRTGYEDAAIEHLLDKYKSLSSHITVEKVDPELHPTFVSMYSTTYTDNCVIVECDNKSKYVDYNAIYETDYSSYYYTGTYDTTFAGESVLTSAINYVTGSKLPVIYNLTGHGELTLSDTYKSLIDKQNMTVKDINLLKEGYIPEDIDVLFINSPVNDISSEEKDTILSYLQNGGKLLLITAIQETETFDNLMEIMNYYGTDMINGIVLDNNEQYNAWGTPYYLLPEVNPHTITNPVLNNDLLILMAVAHGIRINEDKRDTVYVSSLLDTTGDSIAKSAEYNITTYEKEEGDEEGPFSVAVAITENASESETTQIVWFASNSIIDDSADQMVSGANSDTFINSLMWMCEVNESNIAIHSKPLTYEYLTMNTGTASLLKLLFVVVIPAAYLVFGIVTVVRRKNK